MQTLEFLDRPLLLFFVLHFTLGRLPGYGFARQQLVAHSGVIGEGGRDHRGLHQILALSVIEDVQVGVMGTSVVVEVILNELEAGQADGVECDVVGTAGIAIGHGVGTHVSEGFQPRFEHLSDGRVALRVDAADLATTVVEIEVCRQLGMIRLDTYGPA